MRLVSFFVLLGVLAGGLAPVLSAQEKAPPKVLFEGENVEGEVWANVSLTRQRFEESYLPMVVMVVNRADRPVVLDRDSFRLIGPDGRRYPMPTLKELRKGYRRFGPDARTVSGAGLPWEVWARDRRLVQSNFFPNLMDSRRALIIDEITLANGYAMIDILYFAKPQGFTAGGALILEVQAVGWSAPVHLGMVLD